MEGRRPKCDQGRQQSSHTANRKGLPAYIDSIGMIFHLPSIFLSWHLSTIGKDGIDTANTDGGCDKVSVINPNGLTLQGRLTQPCISITYMVHTHHGASSQLYNSCLESRDGGARDGVSLHTGLDSCCNPARRRIVDLAVASSYTLRPTGKDVHNIEEGAAHPRMADSWKGKAV